MLKHLCDLGSFGLKAGVSVFSLETLEAVPVLEGQELERTLELSHGAAHLMKKESGSN